MRIIVRWLVGNCQNSVLTSCELLYLVYMRSFKYHHIVVLSRWGASFDSFSFEERRAGNPHAAFCGSRKWVTASSDPVAVWITGGSTRNSFHVSASLISSTNVVSGDRGLHICVRSCDTDLDVKVLLGKVKNMPNDVLFHRRLALTCCPINVRI